MIIFLGNSSNKPEVFLLQIKLGTDVIKTPHYSYDRSMSKNDIISGKFKQKNKSISTPKKLGTGAVKTPYYS